MADLIILKKGKSKTGEFTIMHKKPGETKFTTRLTFRSEVLRDQNFDFLINKNQFFKNEKD